MGWTGRTHCSELGKVQKTGRSPDWWPLRGRWPPSWHWQPQPQVNMWHWQIAQEAARSLMENRPSQCRRQGCTLSKLLAPTWRCNSNRAFTNTTAWGWAKLWVCVWVRTHQYCVFSILENSQTAERGEIRVIASNWKWKNFHIPLKRELLQSQGKQEGS